MSRFVKICMFVKNTFEYDARVTKEAKSLVADGHDVTVVALLDPRVTAPRERTADGVEVVRVPRSSFGVPALNRMAAHYARTIEARHSRLTGEPADRARVHELGRLTDPSTVAPSDDALPQSIGNGATKPPTALSASWGRVTTPVLRSFAVAAGWSFRAAKAALGRPSSRLKNRAIDERMFRAGIATAADVFHAHDLNTLSVGVRCKAHTPGTKLVYDSHELETERSRMASRARQAAVAEEGAGLRHADAFIVASPAWLPWNRELHGAIPERSVTLLNVPEQQELTRSRALHTTLDLPEQSRIVLYQGSIQENRGIEPAIEAVQRLPDVVLVIIGYGYYRPTLEAYVEREGIADRVRFFGPIPNDELLEYTASADVGLCNIVNSSMSYYTSLPNKLFEYVLAGVPVVGSDSPQIGRVVAEEMIGEVCDPEGPDDLAATIETILADPQRYEPGMERAALRYNWDVEKSKLLDLYRDLT